MNKHLVVTILWGSIALLLFSCTLLGQNWVSTNGPTRSDTIVNIAIGSSVGTTRIYAATEKQLIYSTDGGSTWQPTSYSITSPTVVTCDPTNPNTIIAAKPGTVYSSIDGGSSFSNPIPPTLSTTVPIRLAFSTYAGSKLVFLGTDTAGTKTSPTATSLYKSIDSGRTWSAVNYFKDTVHTNIRDIMYHPYNQNIVWVCGTTPAPPYMIGDGADYYYDANNATIKTNGVWKSTDAGGTWIRQTEGMPLHGPNVLSMAFSKSPASDTILIAIARKYGDVDSVYIRNLTDTSWSGINKLPSGVLDVRAMRISVNHPDTIVAATDNGLVLSTDRGATWNLENTGLKNVDLRDVIFDPSNNATIYASTGQSIYKSTNLGSNWTRLHTDSTGLSPSSVDIRSGKQFTVSKTSSLVNTTFSGLWDDGTYLASGAFEGRCASINPNYTNYIYACGDSQTYNGTNRTDAKVYVSTDNGSSWARGYANSDYSASMTFTTVLADPASGSTRVYAAGKLSNSTGSHNYYYSTNKGVTWSVSYGGAIGSYTQTVNCLAFDTTGAGSSNSSIIYAGLMTDGLYKTTNGGSSWNEYLSGKSILSIMLNRQSPSIIYAGGYPGIYKSTNSGSTFGSPLRTDTVTKIIMDHQYPTSTNDLYIIGHNGNNIYRSTDGGSSWTDITGSIPTPVNDLRQDPSNDSLIYAATNSGVYKFNPSPRIPTGFDMSGDLCTPCVLDYRPLSMSSCHPEPVWSANTESDITGYEIYRSIDGGGYEYAGATNSSTFGWVDNNVTTDSKCSGSHDATYKIRAKDNWGNYSDFTDVIHVTAITVPMGKAVAPHEYNQGPTSYALWQNTPNPFNPTTTIQYDLISTVNVKLVLYDVLGREVRTLVDGLQTAGRYSVKIDGNNLSSGLYFYRIQAGKFSAMKKMLLMK
ncbi:MAG: T9SS type A sorting domain-containing protein [Bacteroidota bacterium]